MPLRFNMLLEEAGLNLSDVRLLRHMTLLPNGNTPYDLWKADRALLEAYQACQWHKDRSRFLRPWWACFLGTRDGRTLFAGLYEVGEPALVEREFLFEPTGEVLPAGAFDHFPLAFSDRMAAYAGRLYVDWGGGGSGKRAWSQRAEVQEKPITELHLDEAEQPFPGLMQLAMPLSRLVESPPSWLAPMADARGVYLLTCPRTGELYVGSASGENGFWGRWQAYAADGHGGNVALMGRPPADWVVSVLQVAGSADGAAAILAMETLWKRKLMAREFGLCRN